jgi:hypothetical protein
LTESDESDGEFDDVLYSIEWWWRWRLVRTVSPIFITV